MKAPAICKSPPSNVKGGRSGWPVFSEDDVGAHPRLDVHTKLTEVL